MVAAERNTEAVNAIIAAPLQLETWVGTTAKRRRTQEAKRRLPSFPFGKAR
jgi:hypothetical protein